MRERYSSIKFSQGSLDRLKSRLTLPNGVNIIRDMSEHGGGEIVNNQPAGNKLRVIGRRVRAQRREARRLQTENELGPKDTSRPQELAVGMDQDPRFTSIIDARKAYWEKLRPGFFDKSLHRGTLILKQDARREFWKRYPVDAVEYAEKERVRIYPDYSQDPAVQEAKDSIATRIKGGVDFTSANVWVWQEFAKKYPDKAKAYGAHDGNIQYGLASIDGQEVEFSGVSSKAEMFSRTT